MGCSTATGARRGVFDLGHQPRGIATAPQQSALQRIGRRIKKSGGCPPGLNPRECFEEVIKSKDMYSLNQSAVAPYMPDLLKVTKSDTVPKEATALLPPTEAEYLLHPEQHLVRQPEEIEAWSSEHGDFQPYWDETLRNDREARLDLYKKLAAKSLLGFRKKIRTKVGVFFVWKSEKRGIRLIIDARMPNACHRRPPKTKLGGAAGLSELDAVLEDDDLDLATSGYGGLVEMPAQFFGDTGDVSDAFYQFSVKSLAEWFGLDDPVLAHEFDVTEVWNPDTQLMEAVEPNQSLFPVFYGMPQGWAWALHFCNTAVEFGMTKSIPASSFIKDGMTAPDPRLGPVGSVYVDNIAVFGFVQAVVHHCFDQAVENLERAGFVLHELEKGTNEVTNVGVVVDTKQCKLRHTKKRSWRLYLALKHFLRMKRATSEVVRVLAGHIVHYFSIQRSGMSCLHHTYKFIYQWLDGKSHPIPGVVKREIRMVVGLIFQVEVDLGAPYSPVAFCGDSSSYGYCFQVAEAPKEEQKPLFRFHERWRFLEVEEGIGLGLGSHHHSWSADFDLPKTAYVKWLCEREGIPVPGGDVLERGTQSSCQHGRRFKEVELVGMVPKLPGTLLDPLRWRTLVKRKWSHREPIHLKEGRVALMSLRRASRDVALHGHRLLTLCDNLSALMAFDKGRAQDLSLLSLCRRAGALQFACEIRWHLRYVESARNPSDKDSRVFSHPFKRKSLQEREPTVRERFGTGKIQNGLAPPAGGGPSVPLPGSSTSARRLQPTVTFGRGAGGTPQHGVEPYASAHARIDRSKGCVFENSTIQGDELDGLSGKPCFRSSPACSDSEGQHRDLCTDNSQSCSTRSLKQTMPSAPRSAKTSSSKPVQAQCFLELFSGTARLTSAVRSKGIRCGIPFDLSFGKEFDLSRHDVQRLILDWISSGRIWFLHIGTPCTIFSIANTGKVRGRRVQQSLVLAKFTAKLIRACADHGVWFSLENPQTSKLFQLKVIYNALTYASVFYVHYDCCRFGCPFRKPSTLATNMVQLHALGRRCICNGPHSEQLRGRVRVEGADGKLRWFWKTSLAGEYSGMLCHEWARLLRREAPGHVLVGDREAFFLPGWHEEIMQVSGTRFTKPIIKLKSCPFNYIPPWSGAVDQWGTGSQTRAQKGASKGAQSSWHSTRFFAKGAVEERSY